MAKQKYLEDINGNKIYPIGHTKAIYDNDGIVLENRLVNMKNEAKSYTDTKVANLVNGAPETLDTLKEVADAIEANQDVVDALDNAIGNKANKTDVELALNDKANKTDVATALSAKLDTNGNSSDTTVMFEESSAKNNINSGEKQSVLWGKVKKWFSSLKSVAFTGDYNDLDNAPEIPQAVAVKGDNESVYRTGNVNITKDNIGLGNVPNVTTDDQTPTYTQATTRENIASGEKLSIAFGKIKKWFADLQTVAFTGSYNNLKDIPSIPEATAVKGDSENTYRTGNVNITKANIGLSNVNNTSDLNKPISTATQLALDDKASIDHAHTAAEIGALPITGGDLMGDLGIISDYPTIYLGELGVTISSSETDTDGWCGSATNISSDYLNLPLYGTMMLNENPIPFPADYIECNGASSQRTVNAPQFRPVIGATLRIKFSNVVTTTSEVTLNVNSLGAKSIIVPSRDSNGNLIYTPVTSANTWEANEIVDFLYDGTNLIAINSTGDFVQKKNPKPATIVIGTSLMGHDACDVDFLCDGTDDQTEINLAINALPSTGGKIVLLEGTYNISERIDIRKSNTTIEGMGRVNTTISMPSTAGIYFHNDYCKMLDLTIKNSTTTTSAYCGCIFLDHNKNCIIKDVEVSGMIYGINITNILGSHAHHIIDSIYSHDNTYGIHINATGCIISNCILRNNNRGVNFERGFDIVSNNEIFNNTYGVFVSSNVTGVKCANNIIIRGTGQTSDYSSSQYTIYVSNSTGGNDFSDNYILGKNYVNNGSETNTFNNNRYN